jgi:hypothetical protein
MPVIPLLPYPTQLPQDFYAKNLPTPSPPPPPVSPPPPPVIPTPPPDEAINSGGIYYGNTPPADPQNGWLWMQLTNGLVYIYTSPGVWSQIGTNW